MFYGGYDYQLGKDRIEQARREIQRDRLEARLAENTRTADAGSGPRGTFYRGTTLVATLFK